MVSAKSREDAEQQAINALQGMDVYGADDTTVSGCSVRVALEFTDPDTDDSQCIKVDRPPHVVEFGA